MTRLKAMKTIILGVGNTLLSDEGVGIHVLDALAKSGMPREGVDLIDGGTLSFTLAVAIEEADSLIVVDAAQLKSPPGTLHLFRGEEMDRFLLGQRKSSVHEVGLTDLMAIARLTERWPERRAMLAIQPEKLDWGDAPTPQVQSAIPEACRQIEALLEEWHALH
jgi:hydrogenase maturation protease